MTRMHVLWPKIILLYVTRPKISLAYITRPKLPSPILCPTKNHVGMIFTYTLRACQKTPMINLNTHPNVHRIYLIEISIGNIAVPLRCKLLFGVVSTVRIFICTVQTGFQYLRLKWVQSYQVNEILLSTDCTWKTVELWRVISWPISSQFSRINTRSISTRQVLLISIGIICYKLTPRSKFWSARSCSN